MKFVSLGLAVMLLALGAQAQDDRPHALIETPELAPEVAAGTLPGVAKRIPQEPLRVDLAARGRETGQHGGQLRMFIGRAKDVRYMAVWGYARLVCYDENYTLVPDILRAIDTSPDGRSVTLHLRRGHKWSDGAPFTTEDFRYWWEDVALNPELSPAGPPTEMLVNAHPPRVEVIDPVTIRFSWPIPNPQFLPALAAARPLYIYRPAHYMKQFHAKYTPPGEMAEEIARSGKKTWAALHNLKDNLDKFDNPDLPVLQPWVNTSKKNGQRYILRRNPFYHRIDDAGQQLPYIDGIDMEVVASGLVAAKSTMGEADLQIRGLGFSDAPVLKRGEENGHYRTLLWRSGSASQVAIYPNLNYFDDVWREIFRDVRFRRALSLGISRKAINKVLYFGLGKERAMAALEESPFFDAENTNAWARYDPDAANALLDQMGLSARNGAGFRLLPDGRPMEIVIEITGQSREVADTLELVAATWKELGLRLIVRPLDRDVLRNRAYAGRSMMVGWFGWNVGIPTPNMAPTEMTPVDQADYAWPKWGEYFQTKGKKGQAPDLAPAQKLLDLYRQWEQAINDAERSTIWRQILAINADQVFAIGTVARAPIPVVINARLRNVPDDAIYAWDPGGQIGIHRMDEFYFEDARAR